MIKISTKEQFEEILQNNQFVFVDFYADWCGPCKMMAPIVEQFDEATKGEVKVVKIDVDENQDLSALYKITSIPTLMLFKNGKVVEAEVGYRSLANLHEMVQKNKN